MGATYTRQSTYADGDTITAAHTNDEFDQLLAAFASSSGHTHDGTEAEGGPITSLLGNTLTFGAATAGTDITITFDGETNDGVLKWMEDEDYFEFSDDILVASTEKLQLRDTGIYLYSSTDGQLDAIADGEVAITSPIVDIDASTGIALDGANLNSTWTVNTTNKIQWRDSGLYINSSTDGQLDIVADSEVQIAATTVDINGNVDVSGTLAVAGVLTGASLDISGDIDIDGTTNLDVVDIDGAVDMASTLTVAGVVDITDTTDSSDATGDTGALRTEGGASIAKKLYVGTDLDVDGTTNLDAVDIDGAVQLDATLTIGANDQGYDVILYGDTASANMTWDTSADDLIFNGAAGLIVPDGQFTLGSTAVSATAAEINLIDGGTSRGTTAVASGDGILINDAGTMRMTNVDTVSTYFSSHNVGGSNIVTTGALNSGSITSGFGTIDTGSSAITTTGVITGGTLEATTDTAAGDNAAIGYTAAEGLILTGQGSTNDVTIKNDADTIVMRVPTGTDDVVFADNVTISGDLTVSGDTTTVSTTNMVVSDNLIELNNGATSNSNDSGLVIERGSTGDNAIFMWDESADTFVLGTTTATGSATGNISVTDGALQAGSLDISGNIDIDGTANLDVVDIDGAVSIDATTTVGTDNKIQFRDTGLYLHSSTDGQLDIVADTEIQIAATTVDLNGNLDVSGTSTLTGNVTLGGQLIMPDVTSAKILVADGTSYQEVAVSGDVTIANTGAVTIAANAVEGSMLNDNVISGQTALTSGLATDDELLVSDGGTLKRMDVSVLTTLTDDNATALAIALG